MIWYVRLWLMCVEGVGASFSLLFVVAVVVVIIHADDEFGKLAGRHIDRQIVDRSID